MSNRSDIERGRLVYTEKLGWIDVGHAKGDDAKRLMNAINSGDDTKENYFIIKYSQYMGLGLKYGTARITRWKVRRGLSLHDKQRVALTIMMYTSHLFESHQDTFPFNWYTDSGYSGEDLVSNLLGFYQAINQINYLAQLNPINKTDALKRWDYYGPIGKYKNKTFKPLLFPDPEKYPNNAIPYYSSLPSFMKMISPIDDIDKSQILLHIEDRTGYNIGIERDVGITKE
ncbi:hypothetical protein HKX68_09530 [Dickeya dadantii]|uniref:hypothetical protein n=1 Tax=Dickeya dadantii TaxID=204038 RepID=UPI001372C80A|nr:hypothetical protein [Dickeya dadantii]NAT76705.1 hypothetical protein [Dickeya dadantii]NPE63187.1 hypothetical protein [Dickeya dadantii]